MQKWIFNIVIYINLSGGNEITDSCSTMVFFSWKIIRKIISANKPLKEFKFKQYLFSSIARLLLKLGRIVEVS